MPAVSQAGALPLGASASEQLWMPNIVYVKPGVAQLLSQATTFCFRIDMLGPADLSSNVTNKPFTSGGI
jgi:hypothetical protein